MSRSSMMLQVALSVSLVSFPCCLRDASYAWAKDDPLTDDEVVVRSEAGAHRLLLPKDWPVERQHGVTSPASIEQYLSMKFAQVRERFQQTDARFDAIEKRLEALEQENTRLLKQLRLLEKRAEEKEVTNGHTTQEP